MQIIECYLSIAPIAEKKMMQAPYPPTTPTMNIKRVAMKLLSSNVSTIAARIWADVRRIPPIRIVFLGPYLLYK